MKKYLFLALLVLTMSVVYPNRLAFAVDGQQIIRKEELKTIKGSDKIFTGNVTVQPLYPANNEMRSSGGSVTFEPGARSNWHIHPVGQVLIVTSGNGRTQEWGKPVQEIKAGDIVMCPVGVKHWHGAAPGSAMTHISICSVIISPLPPQSK